MVSLSFSLDKGKLFWYNPTMMGDYNLLMETMITILLAGAATCFWLNYKNRGLLTEDWTIFIGLCTGILFIAAMVFAGFHANNLYNHQCIDEESAKKLIETNTALRKIIEEYWKN